MAVTLITGAAGALGGAVAIRLEKERHRIAAVDLPHTGERLRTLRGVLPLAFDTNDPAAWASSVAQIERELGPLDGAVLVAGGWQGGGSVAARPDDAILRAMLQMNVESAYRALRALLPSLVARRKGSIVVVGARQALRPELGGGAAEYTASKSAVVALAQAVAAEVLDSGVRVNAVLPSIIDTAANRAAMPSADASRWVAPDSLADVVAFLLSDAARDVSGAAIPVFGRA